MYMYSARSPHYLICILLHITHPLLCIINRVLVLQFNITLIRVHTNNHLHNGTYIITQEIHVLHASASHNIMYILKHVFF